MQHVECLIRRQLDFGDRGVAGGIAEDRFLVLLQIWAMKVQRLLISVTRNCCFRVHLLIVDSFFAAFLALNDSGDPHFTVIVDELLCGSRLIIGKILNYLDFLVRQRVHCCVLGILVRRNFLFFSFLAVRFLCGCSCLIQHVYFLRGQASFGVLIFLILHSLLLGLWR